MALGKSKSGSIARDLLGLYRRFGKFCFLVFECTTPVLHDIGHVVVGNGYSLLFLSLLLAGNRVSVLLGKNKKNGAVYISVSIFFDLLSWHIYVW